MDPIRTAGSALIMRSFVFFLIALGLSVPAANAGTVRIAALKFGTVDWELNVIKTHGLDKAQGFDLEIIDIANTGAGSVALEAGAADMIVTDWLWVSRQRAEGRGFTFMPYSTSVGALMVPGNSPITGLDGLKGKKLGIAGGPVDKSWLILRAATLGRHGLDLDSAADKMFAAPPLLNQEILSGRLDAVITFWNFAAELKAKGFREVIEVEDAAKELGLASKVPLLGYVFDEQWAARNKDDAMAMMRASLAAKDILAHSDAEWERLKPLMNAGDEQTFRALRDSYRAGIPEHWGEQERTDAAKLFTVLAKLGGTQLVGSSSALAPGTFWAPVSY